MERNGPFFSIITASFNSDLTIYKTLESLRIQTYPFFEHIVIDGNSTDNTKKILKAYENKYNLRWISETDEGIADALNKGIDMAKGTYIVVIQADDCLLDSNTLKSVQKIIKQDFKDIYSFPVIKDMPQGKQLKKPKRPIWFNHFKFIFLHQGCFVNRNVFRTIGHFNPKIKIAMDYDFFYRAIQIQSSISFQKMPVTLMGGQGIGTVTANTKLRIKEERLVQLLNEKDALWCIMQRLFHILYKPYKLYLKNNLDQLIHGR